MPLLPQAQQPALQVADGFATAEECAAVLARFGDGAWVEAHADFHGWDAHGFVAEVEASQDPALDALCRRMEAQIGRPSAGRRTLRLRYYQEGQGHPLHCDAYEIEGLQLQVTALLYLMDTEAGGETRFPQARPAPVSVAPRLGRVVVWTSTLPDGRPDPASVHDAAPVIRGAKAALLGFVYGPPPEPLRGLATEAPVP